MSKKPADESLDLINDILSETDPEFVQELNTIDPKALNGKEIQTIAEESVETTSLRARFWETRDTQFKVILLCAGFLVGVGLPLLTMAYMGWFTPQFLEAEGFSFKSIHDETFIVKSSEGTENLLKLFPVVVYTVEIPEKTYPLKSTGKAVYGRFSFYLEFESAADAAVYASQKDHVAEVIFNVLRKTTIEDWSGVSGKEKIRNELLVSINKSINVRARMLRFKDIYI